MICISVLCVVLALSSIDALSPIEIYDRINTLKFQISWAVVDDVLDVYHDAKTSKISTKELDKKFLAAANAAFNRMEPQIRELIKVSGSSPEIIADQLAREIRENQALKNAMPSGGELTPRFSGVIGTIGTIAYDIVKAITNIVIGPTK